MNFTGHHPLISLQARLNVCDRPEKYVKLKKDLEGKLTVRSRSYSFTLISYKGSPEINVLRDGHQVSRTSDFIMYAVEAEFIDSVVAQFGPCVFLTLWRSVVQFNSTRDPLQPLN